MLITYLAFSNYVSDPKNFSLLMKVLGPEMKNVVKELEGEDASANAG